MSRCQRKLTENTGLMKDDDKFNKIYVNSLLIYTTLCIKNKFQKIIFEHLILSIQF